jgi:uncharacterized membrane protein
MVIPEWLIIMCVSMLPWLELRGAIPLAILTYGWEWWQAFPIAIIGNIIPVPFILIFFKYAEKIIRKYGILDHFLDKLFEKTRRKADNKIKKYEEIALIIFVAIPFPFTGAWTASLIAYLFDLKIGKSILTILIGVIIAGIIMTILTISGKRLFFSF